MPSAPSPRPTPLPGRWGVAIALAGTMIAAKIAAKGLSYVGMALVAATQDEAYLRRGDAALLLDLTGLADRKPRRRSRSR